MTEQVMELVRALGGAGQDEEVGRWGGAKGEYSNVTGPAICSGLMEVGGN